MTKKGISIIICCYNSESRLPETLEYLSKQAISKDIPVELIIVNNASTDRTKEIAWEEWNKYDSHFLFRIVDEERSGLMFARKRGFRESQYEYILFCDDDNWLQYDYLQKAFDLMESNSQIGALGGQGISVSDVDFPEWFSDFEKGYVVGQQSNDSGDISKRGYLWGAGLVTRRTLLNQIFDDKYPLLLVGRAGSNLTAGDDNEICRRILLLGYTLYYSTFLLFHHYIAPNRLTWAYKNKLYDGFDISRGIQQKYSFIYKEMKKNMLNRMMGILYNTLKLLLKPEKSKNYLKTILLVQIGLMFKCAKISNDLEYKIILRFLFNNKVKK